MKFVFAVMLALAATLMLSGCTSDANAAANAGANAQADANAAGANANANANAGANADADAAANAGNQNPNAGGANAGANVNADANANANSGASSGSVGTAAGNAASALADLFGLKNSRGWSVNYQVTTVGRNTPPITSTMGMYFKDEKHIRFDGAYSGVETRSYVSGEDMFTCFHSKSSWSCMKIPDYNKTTSEELESDFTSDPESYDVQQLPPRTIAGTATSCFKITVENGWAEYCLSAEGVPLYIHSEGDSEGYTYSSTTIATSYKLSVSDSDFVLPATPTDTLDYESMAAAYGGGSVFGEASDSGAAGNAAVGASAYAGVECSVCSYLSGSQNTDCLAGCSG